jgi:hypothetical protein
MFGIKLKPREGISFAELHFARQLGAMLENTSTHGLHVRVNGV